MKIISARDNIFKVSAKPEGYEDMKAATRAMARRENALAALGGPVGTPRLTSDRLALLGPEWKLRKDRKNGFAYMARRSGVGPDGQPVTHIVTVGDPRSEGDITVDHTVVGADGSPSSFYTTRKNIDAMHEPDWETSRGPQIHSYHDISPGARHRAQTFKRITGDTSRFREVPPVLPGRLEKGRQHVNLKDSLTPEGLKQFDSGTLHGEMSGGTYQWRHFSTPIAYVSRIPGEKSSIVITSRGRDWSGPTGWAHSTQGLIHHLKSNAESQGYHVKYDDDWAPPQEHADRFAIAGWDRDPYTGDFTRTLVGDRGNLVHLRATAIHNPGANSLYYPNNTPRYNLETYRGSKGSGLLPVNLSRHHDLRSQFRTPEEVIGSADSHISKFGSATDPVLM